MGVEWERFGFITLALFVFGFGYNALVDWLERTGRERGYTALLVVFGVLVTVMASAALIGWRDAALALACFCASGFWMAVGSFWRHGTQREKDVRGIEELARAYLRGGESDRSENRGDELASGHEPGQARQSKSA
jgi:Na+/melibiose symporter-like transporter